MTKKVQSRDNLVTTVDFNPKIRTTALEGNIYRKKIGIYGKRRTNTKWLELTRAGKITVI